MDMNEYENKRRIEARISSDMKIREERMIHAFVAFWVFLGLGLVAGLIFGLPRYSVWERAMKGKAELARANYNRQIVVSESEAKQEAARHLAQAEIERAKGVAEANRIIGASLHQNEAYLRWLWIEAMADKHTGSTVVYVPTETNLPILEAGWGRHGGVTAEQK